MDSLLNKMRMLTPGPTPLPEVARLALAQDMIHHRKERFKEIMLAVQKRLSVLFGTASPVLPLACTGSGAMTAAVYSLFEPGDKVLTVEAGKFGQRWTEIAISRKLDCQRLMLDWGSVPTAEQIAGALANDASIRGVLIQHSETSTGALLPVREIAKVTRESEALLVVDGISAVGICPCPMEEWGIDCLLTGSQKGLMLPPGLALLALSRRAWQRAGQVAPGCYYFNLPLERAHVEKGQTTFTTPVNLIVGLDASLGLLLANGLDEVYRKQWALTCMARAGGQAMGLEPLVKEHYAWGVTSFLMPDGIDAKIILDAMRLKFGVIMAGGQDRLKGRIVRFGHMGWVDWGDCAAGLTALARALQDSGARINGGFMDAAMTAYEKALNAWPAGA